MLDSLWVKYSGLEFVNGGLDRVLIVVAVASVIVEDVASLAEQRYLPALAPVASPA